MTKESWKVLLPDGESVLLALLVIMLLTGVLKILVGAVLTTMNPIVGGLYTFFFATVIGKMVSKALLTTVILAVLVLALNYVGINNIYVAKEALTAYIPLAVGLAAIWYIQHKCF